MQESRTFDRKRTAEAWATKREAEIDEAIGAGRIPAPSSARKMTLADTIDTYIRASLRQIGKTMEQVQRAIRAEGVS